jgi:hypothetical protein
MEKVDRSNEVPEHPTGTALDVAIGEVVERFLRDLIIVDYDVLDRGRREGDCG